MSNDLKETFANIIIGSAINIVLTMFMFGVPSDIAVGTNLVFMIHSFTRTYLLRREFRKLENGRS